MSMNYDSSADEYAAALREKAALDASGGVASPAPTPTANDVIAQRNADTASGGWGSWFNWGGGGNPSGSDSGIPWTQIDEAYKWPIEKRMAQLQMLTGSSEPVSGQGPDAKWRLRNGEVLNEAAILKLSTTNPDYFFPKERTNSGSGGPPASYYAGQIAYWHGLLKQGQDELQFKREDAIRAEANARFGRNAQLIGLQTGNADLENRGKNIVFEQSSAVANAKNDIQKLMIQQSNLQAQYDNAVELANAAASNDASRFNAQMGFNVEQANVAAQQRKQEQLQSLARDISEAAKAPGDYGKLAALTLANGGWGQENTAIGRGADLRTADSLAPTESLLRNRNDVMAQPDRPFTFTPITPTLAKSVTLERIDPLRFTTPTPTLTAADVERQRQAGATAISNLAGTGGTGAAPTNSAGGSLQVVNGQPVFVASSGQTYGTSDGQFVAAATGGTIPRYEDGGVNNNGEFNPAAIYQTLRSGGASEQQATDFINTILRSDEALARNTAAQQAQQQSMDIEQVAQQMPPTMYRQRYSEPPNYEQTEAELLRLGMSNPYQRPSGYDEGDVAGNVAGWTPQNMGNNAWQDRKQRFDSDFTALKSGQIDGQEFENRNKDLDENQFLQFTRMYGIPAAGSAALAAGAAVPSFMRWLMKGNQTTYRPAFDYNVLQGTVPQGAAPEARIDPNVFRSVGLGGTIEDAQRLGLYAAGGVANGAYISGERGPELNIPIGDQTIVLNQKQMKAAGIDLKKLMEGAKKPKQFANGGMNPREKKDEKWEPTGGGGGRGGFSGGDFPAGYPGGGFTGPYFIAPQGAPTDAAIRGAGIPPINPRANQYEITAGNFYKLPSDMINMLYDAAYQNARSGGNPDAVRWLEGFLGGIKGYQSGGTIPRYASGGIFDQGFGNVRDSDRTLATNFLNDALAKARAGTPFQNGALPSPVYASSPGFSPIVTKVLGSLSSMAQGVPTEYFQELAARYRPAGVRESVTQRSA